MCFQVLSSLSMTNLFFLPEYDENPKAFFWKFLEYKMPHIELTNSLTMSTIVTSNDNGALHESYVTNEATPMNSTV